MNSNSGPASAVPVHPKAATPAAAVVGGDASRRALTANSSAALGTLGIVSDTSPGVALGTTIVWVDDRLPNGAVTDADGGDNWNWVSQDPVPRSGRVANQSNLGDGLHEHYFYNAVDTLPVVTGDILFAHVYLDPLNLPREIMLQWNNGNWEHRAYWGESDITYGEEGSAGRYFMGPLPPSGQWAQLLVPASVVGIENSSLNGIAFTLYGGRATWDYAGKCSPLSATTASALGAGSAPSPGSLSLASSPSLQLTWSAITPAGSSTPHIQLHLQGQPFTSYLIQVSPDFNLWSSLTTTLTGGDGTSDFNDPQSTDGNGYYRPLLQPSAAGVALDPLEAGSIAEQRILVKPNAGVDLGVLNLVLGTQVLQAFPAMGNLAIVQVPPGQTAQQLIAAYQNSGTVQYAEPDHVVHLLLTPVAPNDPQYANGTLWGLHNTGQLGGTPGTDIDAPDGWALQHSADNIIVGVLDTGVRYTHEDLAANMWTQPGGTNHGINTLNGTDNPWDDYGHGTHVSGTIGGVGNNNLGVVGVAWTVQLMECEFIDSQGNGTISDAITCIDFARNHGAKIINASWGTTNFTSTALHDAIASARDAGIIFVAACGNSSNDNDGPNAVFPASYTDLDNVVAVAATTRNDQLASFSNFGAKRVHLGAPGEDISSSYNADDSSYVSFSGTSMAAAYVSGACAVVWAHFPGDSYKQIIQRILNGTDPIPALTGKTITGGRLNLFRALNGSPPPPPPVAHFSANPTSGNAPLMVQFTDQSSGTVTSRDWDFGDGSAHSSDPNPSHTYTNAGTFTVMLTVSGAGSTSSTSQTLTVTNSSGGSTLPVLTIAATQPDAYVTNGTPAIVRFHRTGDTSQSYQVFWSFSGTATNGVDYGPLPTNSPFPAGQADADLTIKPIDHGQNGDWTVIVKLEPGADYQIGASNSATAVIHGHPTSTSGPTADFTANPTSGNAPLTVQFTDQSSGTVSSRDWDFGDGSAHSSAQNPSHTYTSAGTFTVTLTVSGAGTTSTKTGTIQVNNPPPPPPPPPVANFSANPTSGNAPLTVQFTDQSSGTISSRDWDFGDGSAHSSAQNPSHTYASAGTFTVTLTVSGAGTTSTKTGTIQVNNPPPPPPPPPAANFSANPTLGNAPLTVQFTDQSSGTVSSRDWDFGDGSAHSSAQNPSHTYASAGTFTVTLTVSGAGTTSTKTGTIQVNNPPPPPPPPPAANFSANPTSGNAPLTVQFTDESTGTIVTWDWDFGDGLPHSSSRNPSHLYLLPGDFAATLTVTGADGTTSSKSVTIHVAIGLPLPQPSPTPLPLPLSPGP